MLLFNKDNKYDIKNYLNLNNKILIFYNKCNCDIKIYFLILKIMILKKRMIKLKN